MWGREGKKRRGRPEEKLRTKKSEAARKGPGKGICERKKTEVKVQPFLFSEHKNKTLKKMKKPNGKKKANRTDAGGEKTKRLPCCCAVMG